MNEEFYVAKTDDNNNESVEEEKIVVVYVEHVSHGASGKRNTGISTTVLVSKGKQLGVAKGTGAMVKDAIRSGVAKAKKRMKYYSFARRSTIPFEIVGRYHSAKVILKPAKPGYGLKTGGVVRNVMESLGIENLVSKRYGSNTKRTSLLAVIDGIDKIQNLYENFKIRNRIKKEGMKNEI